MLSAFTAVLHVPNLSQPEELITVLEQFDLFNKQDIQKIYNQISGHK